MWCVEDTEISEILTQKLLNVTSIKHPFFCKSACLIYLFIYFLINLDQTMISTSHLTLQAFRIILSQCCVVGAKAI